MMGRPAGLLRVAFLQVNSDDRGIISRHLVISMVRTVNTVYGSLAVSQVHVDGGSI